MPLLSAGDEAPDFTVRTSAGEVFRLGDLRGVRPAVLFFYPKDFSLGCTAEVCAFRDGHDDILRSGATLLGISRDDDAAHGRFIVKHSLPFPLVADTDGRIGRLYGVERAGGVLPPRRVTYVVDSQGRVAGVIHHEVMVWKHVQDAVQAVRNLQRA